MRCNSYLIAEILTSMALVFPTLAAAQTTLYVRAGASGNGTQGNPYGALQDAVTQVMAGATTAPLGPITDDAWDLFRAAVAWADNATLPVAGRPAALVVADVNIFGQTNLDSHMYTKLVSYGYVVELVDDNNWSAWAPANAAAKDVIIIAESVSSGNVVNPHNVAAPVVNCESFLADEWLWGTGTTLNAQTQFIITNPAHPTAAGKSGAVTIFNAPLIVSAMESTSVSAATVVARPPDDPTTLQDEGAYIAILAIDQGATLGDGATVNAARRVHISYHANGGSFGVKWNNPAATINVAGGTYNHAASVNIPTNLSIIGGWNSGFTARNPAANVTSLQAASTRVLFTAYVSSGPMTIDGVTITGQTGAEGGSLWVRGVNAPITVNACTFANCVGEDYPAFYIDDVVSSLTMTSVVVQNCSNNNATGGGRIAQIDDFTGNVTINNFLFQFNTSREYGLVLDDPNGGRTLVENSLFAYNTIMANSDGGGAPAMFVDDGNEAPTVTFRNCDFSSNSALSAASAGMDRGAIRLNNIDCPLTFENCTFTSNSVNDDGAALQINSLDDRGNLTFRDCYFARNRGAIADAGTGPIGHSSAEAGSQLSLIDCIFENNFAAPNASATGAVMYTDECSGNVLIKNCILRYNFCAGDGAALRIENDDKPTTGIYTGRHVIDGCWFEGNIAADSGVIFDNDDNDAAVHISTSDDLIMNCVFINNTSDDYLLRVRGTAGTLVNNTFHGNHVTNANSRLILSDAPTAAKAVVNNIFVNNEIDDGAVPMLESTNAASAFSKVENNIFYNNEGAPNPGFIDNSATPVTLDGRLTGNGNFARDPLFVNAAAGNLRLQATSPAKDAGQVTAAQTDLEGIRRPQYGVYDIGAYEFLASPDAPTDLVALPGDTAVSLQWTGVTAVDGYRMYYATNAGGPYTLGGEVAGLLTTGKVEGLTNGTKYYLVVRAFNAVGEGPSSNEASATPQQGISLGVPWWHLFR